MVGLELLSGVEGAVKIVEHWRKNWRKIIKNWGKKIEEKYREKWRIIRKKLRTGKSVKQI